LDASAASYAIEVVGLRRRFGSVLAVDGLDLRVPTGAVYGFLGPNGSGKSTTIRCVLGLIGADAGTVRLLGRPLAKDRSLFDRIGALVERPALYPHLSALDNLRVVALTAGLGDDQVLRRRLDAALERVGLGEAAGRGVRGFSTGMRQRLGIAIALLRDPTLLVLDEPTEGLDPGGVADVRALIAGLGREGVTVFLSSHVLPEVQQLCDRIAVLNRGRLVAEGATADLLARDAHLTVRFDQPADAERAAAVLAAAGWATEPAAEVEPAGTGLIVVAPPEAGSTVSRLLADGGCYPAELSPRRASLEAVFLELTRGPEA
jgi:ABC-2 type transport system ATP-binding protein